MIQGRILERFRERASEWYCAAIMTIWGSTLLHPSESFVSPAYEAFRPLGENATGAFVASFGLAWLIGLIINGARQRLTSTIRMVCAFVGSIVFGLLAIGFAYSYWQSGVLNTGIGNNALKSALALYSLYWITRDKRKNG